LPLDIGLRRAVILRDRTSDSLEVSLAYRDEAAALGIAAALNYPPKFGSDAAQGAIGQRQVYRDNAVTSGDVAVTPGAAPVADQVNVNLKSGVTSAGRENMQSEAKYAQGMQSEANGHRAMQSEANGKQAMQSEANGRQFMQSEGVIRTGTARERMNSEGVIRTGTARERMSSEAGMGKAARQP